MNPKLTMKIDKLKLQKLNKKYGCFYAGITQHPVPFLTIHLGISKEDGLGDLVI